MVANEQNYGTAPSPELMLEEVTLSEQTLGWVRAHAADEPEALAELATTQEAAFREYDRDIEDLAEAVAIVKREGCLDILRAIVNGDDSLVDSMRADAIDGANQMNLVAALLHGGASTAEILTDETADAEEESLGATVTPLFAEEADRDTLLPTVEPLVERVRTRTPQLLALNDRLTGVPALRLKVHRAISEIGWRPSPTEVLEMCEEMGMNIAQTILELENNPPEDIHRNANQDTILIMRFRDYCQQHFPGRYEALVEKLAAIHEAQTTPGQLPGQSRGEN